MNKLVHFLEIKKIDYYIIMLRSYYDMFEERFKTERQIGLVVACVV